jgi:hypothetical protein
LQPYVTVYSGSADPDAKEAPSTVRKAMQIARGLARDEPKNEATSQEDGQTSETGTRGNDVGASDSRMQHSSDNANPGGALARSRFTSDADQGGNSSGGADEGIGTDAEAGSGGENGDGAQTIRLDVRFRNGYEAAAKAVIALSGTGSEGPPYTVLSWTPVLRAQGEGS